MHCGKQLSFKDIIVYIMYITINWGITKPAQTLTFNDTPLTLKSEHKI